MTCTRCGGSGFLNIEQVPGATCDSLDKVQAWLRETTDVHDVMVCDCCGDGEGWYGQPGEHYTHNDPQGQFGPYTYNGSLAECH